MLQKNDSVQRMREAKNFFESKKKDLEEEIQRFADREIKRLLAPGGFTTTGQVRELFHRRDELNFLLAQIDAALSRPAEKTNDPVPQQGGENRND